MNKFCRNCGTQLNTGAKFCASCGTKFQAAVSTSPGLNAGYQENGHYDNNLRRKHSAKKTIISVCAAVIVVVLAIIFLPKLFGFFPKDNNQNADGVNNVSGQFCSGRAIAINGDDFGEFDPENSYITMDGKEAAIISWTKTFIEVMVPDGISMGKKTIMLTNPPYFQNKSIEKEFIKHNKKKIAGKTLSPTQDNIIKGGDFTFIVPKGAVSDKLEIIIYKYDLPASDDNPYYTVTDEYEITGPKGEHLIFDKPVYFGLDVSDEEEALQSSYQIFDEYHGVWVQAETLYSSDDGNLYLITDHFSGFRKFVSEMYRCGEKWAGKFADNRKEEIAYIYKWGKDKTIKLSKEAYVMVKDNTVEEFVGVTDADEKFIVYYRVSDAKNDPSIPNTAKDMAAAFATAYDIYENMFGLKNMPSTKRKMIVTDLFLDPKNFVNNISSDKVALIPDPIKIYLDPRYNKEGAVASIVTKNISMPSEYSGDSLASTCAHELFHGVQHKQLGFLKTVSMGDGGAKVFIDNRFTGADPEVYKWFSNNKWFMEATAEYAANFICTDLGIGAPIDKRIEASNAYYAFNAVHEYGVSSFLDYIITARYTDEANRKEEFKKLWYAVAKNYGVFTDVNSSLNKFVYQKLKTSTAQMLYEEFWKDVVTRSNMPEIGAIGAGLINKYISTGSDTISSQLGVNKGGVGIFRYNLTPKSIFKDDTALTRSYYLEATPGSMMGEVYRLPGVDMKDRSKGEPPFEGAVNFNDETIKDVLVPYSKGESFALIALFKSQPEKKADMTVKLLSSSIHWDNQEEIEKNVGNSTLKSTDKLIFTPKLPKQKVGAKPFNAVVTLNNSEEYKTKIEKVENGNPFEVGTPMKELPPEKISVNIKVYRDGKLVHEFQSGEVIADAKVYINGSATLVIELTKEELPYEHHFTATAHPEGEYLFDWAYKNGSSEKDTSKNESSVSAKYSEFKEYEPYVTLYDLKNNELDTAKISLILKEIEKPKDEEKPTEAIPEKLDPDSDGKIPIASSGSFVCKTWINTSMDSFSVGGSTLTGANWSYSRGYRGYQLTGTCKPGATVSLNVAGTMGAMGYAMDHKGNDLIMYLKVYDTNGKQIEESSKEIKIIKSKSKSLSDSVSIALPSNASRVEMTGSFSCNWVTPFSGATETVAVSVKLKIDK